jgi:uncharacterized membrane protein YphA (DoxX/SURF4 family)
MKCFHNKNVGLLIIRVFVGIIFIAHGWSKIKGMDGTIEFFASLGFSSFWAYLVSYVELLGGVSLILGYGTKIAGILLAITMLVALVKTGKSDAILALLGATLGLAFTGSGKYGLGSCCGCPCKAGTCQVKE